MSYSPRKYCQYCMQSPPALQVKKQYFWDVDNILILNYFWSHYMPRRLAVQYGLSGNHRRAVPAAARRR